MTIKELNAVCASHIFFTLWTNAQTKDRKMSLDREDPLIMQAFEDVVIDIVEMSNEDDQTLRIIPKMQLIKKGD